MLESKLKERIGLFIILSHFIIIFLVVILYVSGKGFDFEEMTTSISLIIPMFATYTTAIIKYIIKHRERIDTKSKKLTFPFVFISFLIPTLFIIFIVSIIVLKAKGIGFSKFDHFKIILVSSETIFGTYVGLIISSLFEIEVKTKEEKKIEPVDKSNLSDV